MSDLTNFEATRILLKEIKQLESKLNYLFFELKKMREVQTK